jgi:hypothetical protein
VGEAVIVIVELAVTDPFAFDLAVTVYVPAVEL